jgi:hypothetical protein
MTEVASVACFCESYAEARAVFLEACREAGAEILSHCHPLAAPDGAPLFLDEARLGAKDASRVLFLASGTHGIEGFCGSGIQTHLVRNGLADRLPGEVAVVLVHAVNPWGFAWLRRVNEDNVDINRNFLDHDAPYPENPDYAVLDAAMNPAAYDEGSDASFLEALGRFERERGSEVVYRSLSGGQYDHPRGVQFGGRHAVWSNRIQRSIWERQAKSAGLAVNIDIHSGLGPRGVGLVFQTAAATSIDAHLSQAWWPDVIRVEPPQGNDAALVSGLIGPAFSAARGEAASVAVVLEFGTLDMTEVMLAVRADNWLHHHGDRDSALGRAIAQRMRDAFFMTDDAWQGQVCERARDVVDRALAGMSEV